MKEQIIALVTLFSTAVSSVSGTASLASPLPDSRVQVLAQHEFDLTNRLPNKAGNQVFADNILLTLRYIKGDEGELRVDKEKPMAGNINWEKVREPFVASLTLEPREVFAYHDTILPEFKQLPLKTTNAHYTLREGYKSLAGLPGNGVCHLATLINWVASEAGLAVTAKVNHDFYPVPGVPRENGTSIRWGPNGEFNSRNQNLYVRNNFEVPVTFRFDVDKDSVLLSISK